MNQIGKIVLCVSLIVFACESAQAQWVKELGERVKERAKFRTEEKVEEKTDEAMDSLFTKRNRGDSEEELEEVGGGNSSSSNQVYRYDFTATIQVESFDKKKATSETIEQSYGAGSLLSVVDGNTMIHDLSEEKVYMLDTMSHEGQVVSMKWFTKMMGSSSSDDDDETAEVTKTGKTKTMHGYTCYEYIITHEDGKVEAWFAPDVSFDYSDYMMGFSKMMGKKSKTPPSENGYVMEMIAFDESDEKISHMTVIDLSEKSRVIRLSDYELTSMF